VAVADGLTLVDPLADVEVNVPGVMARLVAPVVAQLSVLLEPEVIFVGLAVNELITGLLAAFTVTVSIEVVEPAALVAVRV
jgi:flagellar biosynthesis protein FliR